MINKFLLNGRVQIKKINKDITFWWNGGVRIK